MAPSCVMGWICDACGVQGGGAKDGNQSNGLNDAGMCALRDWGDSSVGVAYIRPYLCCNCSLKVGRVTRAGAKKPLMRLCCKGDPRYEMLC